MIAVKKEYFTYVKFMGFGRLRYYAKDYQEADRIFNQYEPYAGVRLECDGVVLKENEKWL